jgi:hypothetical protein
MPSMRRSRSSGLARVALAVVSAVAPLGAACGAAPRAGEGGSAGGSAGCPTDRPAVAGGPEDIARLARCSSLPGLLIRTGAALDLAPLRGLASITGDLRIGPSVGFSEAALAGLRSVGGTIRVVGNGDLRGLFLPSLEEAGAVSIEGNVSLANLQLPHLRTTRGAFIVSDNADLELLNAASLESVGGALALTGNPALTLVAAGRLARAAAVQIEANPQLPDDIAATLRAVKPAPVKPDP